MGRKNRFVHVEFHTQDMKRLHDFYAAVFDWKFQPMGDEYTVIDAGDGTGGGIHPISPSQPMPTGLVNYVSVDELEPVEEKIKAAGGQVVMSNHEVAEWGRFTFFTDPDGNRMALWRPVKKKEVKKAKKAAKKQKKKAKKAAKKEKKKAKKSASPA
jgi:predicted enzyme related to lactoylglutathione lyase